MLLFDLVISVTLVTAGPTAPLPGALLPIPVLGTPLGGVTSTPLSTRMPPGGCPLERVGDRLVRCDDLTGGGAVAPPHLPERG